MKKIKISLNLAGLVIFDPVVLEKFILENKIMSKNLLEYFNENPNLGNSAINEGILLPVYSITPWDYTIILNTNNTSEIIPEWKLFEINVLFPLKIDSGKVIVSDIYALLEWDKDYYLNFPAEEYRVGVDDEVSIKKGKYSVKIIGFRDINNNDVENRECGYEFILKNVDVLPRINNVNIDDFNFKVDGVSEDSN